MNRIPVGGISLVVVLASLSGADAASAQTDYYNLDRGRPARVEDAVATELYALGLKLAPLRIEQEADGSLSKWVLLPELAYGLAPGTSIEVGVPVVAVADGSTGMERVEVSLFHSLNVETTTLPALAIRGDLEVPVGSESNGVVSSLALIGTRTTRAVRLHLNGRYTLNPPSEDAESPGHGEGRWLVGLAADRAFPLRSLLLIGEVYAIEPVAKSQDVLWTAGGGLRYQVNPYLTLDGGVGRTFSADPGWHITVGASMHLGLRALVRGAAQ